MFERPENLTGTTTRVKTPCGNLYVTVNNLDNKPIEVFARLGHSGGCAASMLQMMCRLASLVLQAGVNLEIIIRAGTNISCPNPSFGENKITSCADAICKVLKNDIKQT